MGKGQCTSLNGHGLMSLQYFYGQEWTPELLPRQLAASRRPKSVLGKMVSPEKGLSFDCVCELLSSCHHHHFQWRMNHLKSLEGHSLPFNISNWGHEVVLWCVSEWLKMHMHTEQVRMRLPRLPTFSILTCAKP